MTARTAHYASLPQSRPCAFCGERIRRGSPATYIVTRLSDVPRVEVYHYVHAGCPLPFSVPSDLSVSRGAFVSPALRLYPSSTTTGELRADLAFDRIAHLTT